MKIIEIKSNKTLTPILADQLVATAAALKNQASEFYLAGAFAEPTDFNCKGVNIKVRPWTRFFDKGINYLTGTSWAGLWTTSI